MKIEIWLDYQCEDAFVTHQNLLDVIDALDLDVEILYRSYMTDCCETQFSKVRAQIHQYNENYQANPNLNTLYAHHLSHLAKKFGLAKEANIALLNAHFMDNVDLSDQASIVKIGLSIGLDEETILNTLETLPFYEAIEQNYVNACARKISTIPHIRLNGKVNIEGYTDKPLLKHLIHYESHKHLNKEHCVDGACERQV